LFSFAVLMEAMSPFLTSLYHKTCYFSTIYNQKSFSPQRKATSIIHYLSAACGGFIIHSSLEKSREINE